MPTSQARVDANRKNATLSTGPRTPAGREQSRKNSLTHGLTGSGRVVADQDVAEIAKRTEMLRVELDPKSTVGKAMIGQIAMLSVRMERSAEQINAATRSNVRHAVEAFDHGRVDRAEDTFDAIAEDPRKSIRVLKRSPEGVDRLIEAWGELRYTLTHPDGPTWGEAELAMATGLLGCRPRQVETSWLEQLSKEVPGDPTAVGLLVELVDEQVAALEAHGETLNFERIELDRLEAPIRALFDASREACLARRYEADASRRFYRALNELRRAEAEFEATGRPTPAELKPEPQPAPEPVRTPVPTARPLGSFCAGATPAAVASEFDDLGDFLGPIGRSEGQPRGLDGRVLAVGRAVVMTS